MIVSLAVHVLTSVHLAQSLKVKSTQLIRMHAQSAEHALLFVLLRQSAFLSKEASAGSSQGDKNLIYY